MESNEKFATYELSGNSLVFRQGMIAQYWSGAFRSVLLK